MKRTPKEVVDQLLTDGFASFVPPVPRYRGPLSTDWKAEYDRLWAHHTDETEAVLSIIEELARRAGGSWRRKNMLILTLESLGTTPPPTNDPMLDKKLERLFQSLEPGEVFTVSGPQLVACLEVAIQQGVVKPVYRLTESDAWTTDLVSLRSLPNGSDPSKIMVAFLRR
jgi:hypothetical protein